ncbi:MAG: gamma-glutamyltransferase [Cyanobacteria bacterium RI_101]|nr:gamma-glutamyltransferase [Cyanobacteria bacterium RI_101]
MASTPGIIAAGHPQTASAGRLILEAGGNAFDAAIAAVLAACVVESSLTSLGGAGFLLAHSAGGDNLLFDFFCQTPQRKKPLAELEFYPVDLDFGGARQVFHIGRGSIGVPGVPAGLFAVHQRLGSLPFSLLAEPALVLARDGFQVNDFIAYTYRLLAPMLTQGAENQGVYAPKGRLLTEGETGQNRRLAHSLEYLVKTGADGFYRGELARHLIESLEGRGYLALEDLAQYRVEVRAPLKGRYRGYDLLTNPAPSSGGALMVFALQLLNRLNLSAYPLGGADYAFLMAEIMALTNQARQNHYDGALYDPQGAENLLRPERVDLYHGELASKLGSTTHISVLDAWGNCASVTASNGEGSGHTAPGTGIMLNNMLGEADLNPQGFHHWPPNRRLSSMMAPTVILKNGRPQLVLGSGGSNRIRTAILQVICHCLDYGLSLPEAIARPRLHWEGGNLDLEPGLTAPAGDFQRVKLWEQTNMFFGGVHGVGLIDGEFVGAGDPRRSGAALISPPG